MRAATLAVVGLLPALITGGTVYLTSAARAKDAEAQRKTAEARILDNYGAYAREQLSRDAALLKAIEPCLPHDALAAPARRATESEPAADVVLDRLAKSEGWRPAR